MRAIVVSPGTANSARIEQVAEPPATDGVMLVRALALGVCGTDREILSGAYGFAPPGESRLVLGHESLGVVEDAPPDAGFARGDHVVGIVRRPDPVPCAACAAGEWDMCRNGRYTERGIKERNGYGAERFRVEPEFAVKVDKDLGLLGVLLEPASVVAKAWDHTERIGKRAQVWAPKSLLVTGAGPVGLLAALMGAQCGLSVHVFDRNDDGEKPKLVRDLGGQYSTDPAIIHTLKPDVIMECTAAPTVIRDCLGATAPAGIVCLAGVSAPGRSFQLDVGGINRSIVLDNECVFGTVNANRRHYEMGAQALARADRNWLARLITRRVSLDHFDEALKRRDGDIKVVIEFGR